MSPLDTSMPDYDTPLRIWPGLITLAIGLIILVYLIARITGDIRRARAQALANTTLTDSTKSTDTPTP